MPDTVPDCKNMLFLIICMEFIKKETLEFFHFYDFYENTVFLQSGTVRALCGHCAGTVRALCGHCSLLHSAKKLTQLCLLTCIRNETSPDSH